MSNGTLPLRIQWWPEGFRFITIASIPRGIEVNFTEDGKTKVHYVNMQGQPIPTDVKIERIK